MGEASKRGAAAVHEALPALGVEALGGLVQVRWNQGEAATPFGQMAYFAEFLNLTGLYRRWVESCPLCYTSPNGSTVADVILRRALQGEVLLSDENQLSLAFVEKDVPARATSTPCW